MEVAASIVGLLAAATNVYTTLSAFLTVCHDAPTIAQTTSDEVRDFRYALLKLRDYVWQSKNITLLGRATTDTSQLILTLASAMTTLAQVEKTFDPLLAQPKMDYIRRIRWGFADSDLSKLLTRIQCHKLTLNLLLTIWLSESAAQAEASNDLLNDTLKGLLDPRYQGPSQFLHPSIYNPSTSNASGHTPHTSITVNPQGPNTSARHSGFLMSGSNTFSIKSGKSLRSKLQNTKPYSGLNAFNSSAQSVLTSERATSWSQSQFTIGSNISVFSLPFTGFDLDTKTISEVKEIHRISLPVDGIALYNKWWYPKMNIASKLPTGELCTLLSTFGLKIGMNEYADLPSTSKWNSESPTFVRGLIKVFDRHVRVGGTRSSFLRTRLNSAIFRQHLRLIDLLLSWCAQNRFGPDIGDVLLEAFRAVVELGHGEIAEQFLEWGAWIAVVYQKPSDGTFELALKSHNIEIVKMFLVHGASPEKGYGKPPYTPLQATAIGRHPVALAHLLLEQGANIEGNCAQESRTPLQLAIEAKNYDMSAMLILRGANPGEAGCDYPPCTPLQAVAMGRYVDSVAIAQALLDQGVNIEVNCEDELRKPLQLAIEARNYEMIKILLKHGANSDEAGYGYPPCTPLQAAIMGRYVDSLALVHVLLDQGVNIEGTCDQEIRKPLEIALDAGNYEMIAMLIERGANPDETGYVNPPCTLLQAAAMGRYADSIVLAQALLDQGVNIEGTCEQERRKPLELAIEVKNYQVIRVLLDHGANPEAFYGIWYSYTPLQAAAIGRVPDPLKLAEFLLEYGVNIEGPYKKEHDTPLMLAITHGNSEAISLLLKHGADPNKVGGSPERTPLQFAIEMGYWDLFDVLQGLLDRGANVDGHTEQDPKTPLQIVVEVDNREVAKLLIARGADVEAHSEDAPITPLQAAVGNRSVEMVVTLILAGAKPYGCQTGQTCPMHVAKTGGVDNSYDDVFKKKESLLHVCVGVRTIT